MTAVRATAGPVATRHAIGIGHPAAGFTLIELMITVAIVALLASLAYPAYTNAVLKGRRAEGRVALLNLMQQQERFLTQSGSYMKFASGTSGNNGTTVSGTGQLIPFKTTSGDTPANAAYDLGAQDCASGTLRECVMVTAAPRRSDPAVGTLSIDSSGVKSCSAPSDKSACWK